jgi:hypothetical protein
METSAVRQRILDVINAARRDAAERRKRNSEAGAAYDKFLDSVATPICRQVAGVLKAERVPVTVNTPAGTVRIVSDRSADDFLEVRLDTAGDRPQVVVHTERVRGRERFVDAEPIRAGVLVDHLTEEDVLEAVAHALRALVDK